MKIFLAKKTTSYVFIAFSVVLYYFVGYELDRTNFLDLILSVGLLFAFFYHFINFSTLNTKFLFFLGLFFRLILLVEIPNLSQDFYRFIWDGRMIFNGFNPFLMTPQSFIEQNSFPVHNAEELFKGMGNLNASHFTNYPPISQFCYWIAALFGSRSILLSVIALRLQIILADIGIFYFGKKILKLLNLPERNIFFYFLNPFIIIELTGNLHFEAVMAFFLVWSMYLLLKKKWVLSAIIFSLSVSTKLIPLLFLPVFFYFFNKDAFPLKKLTFRVKDIIKYSVFCVIVILGLVITFMPFVNAALISNYSKSVGLWFTNFEFNASVYYIIRWIGFQWVGWNIIGAVGKILPIIVFLLIIALSLFVNNANPKKLFTTMLFSICVYLLLSTTVHPWYAVIPLLISTFTTYRFIIVWSFTIFFSYSAYSKSGFNEQLVWVALQYLLVFSYLIYECYYGCALIIENNKDH